MRELTALKVAEIKNAASIYLGTDAATRGEVVRCNTAEVTGPRELDDYHLAGVYGTAGVPVEVAQLRYSADGAGGAPDYYALTKLASDAVNSGLQAGKGVLVVGGTCLHAPGVAGGIRRAFGGGAKIGIIWMDAHGDLNTPDTSHSGMLGGMPFAATIGLCMEDWRKSCGLEPPIDSGLAILADGRNLDPEEVENISRTSLTVVDTAAFLDERSWEARVRELADRVDALYLHIDADIVDAKYVPGHNTPEGGGPDIQPLLRNIRAVMQTGKVPVVTLASVYFGPRAEAEVTRDGAILTGIRMVGTILGSWKQQPDCMHGA